MFILKDMIIFSTKNKITQYKRNLEKFRLVHFLIETQHIILSTPGVFNLHPHCLYLRQRSCLKHIWEIFLDGWELIRVGGLITIS